jgi:hypothetical protein
MRLRTWWLAILLPVSVLLVGCPPGGTSTGPDCSPDDPACGGGTASLSINDVTVTEGTGGTVDAVFTVSLSGPSGASVTVDYATSNSSATAPEDFVSTSGQLVFTGGSLSQEITVVVVSDAIDESTAETFTVRLSAPVNATISDGIGRGTITDDDP